MRKGDILEWRAVNGICRGIVTESENGELICRVDDKTAFPLKDLLDSLVSARNL
jgi:hypothetical protein